MKTPPKPKRAKRSAAERWRACSVQGRKAVLDNLRYDCTGWKAEALEMAPPGAKECRDAAKATRAALAILREAGKR